MEEPRTPYDFKELFVEFSARRYMGDSMSEAVSPNNLVAMSMFESGGLGYLGTSLYFGPDLFSSLRHEISGSSRENWIESILLNAVRDQDIGNEMHRLLDEDLKGAGRTDLIKGGITLLHKARVIASYRVRNTVSLMQQPSNSTRAENTSTFRVILRSLVGGNGGSRRDSLLYFTYSTSFPLFQIILRDATKLSKIPPIEFDQQAPTTKEISLQAGSETASQTSSMLSGGQVQQRRSDQSSNRDTYQDSESLTRTPLSHTRGSQDILERQGKAKIRCASARGYTIDDGPWLYYLGHKDQARSGEYTEIKDEDSYLTMIGRIREACRKDASIIYYVVLCHSMDKKASDKWRLLRNEEAEAEKQFQKACRNGEISGISINENDVDYEVDEDDIGEPYLEWMAKGMACPKKE